MSDVRPLIRPHSLGADVVAYSLLLTVDLAEGPVQTPLPVDLVTVHLVERD